MSPILRFPDRAVGFLYRDLGPREELRRIGPAQGVVEVERDARLHVQVTDSACLPCLAPLAPDGVVSLSLNKTALTDSDMAAIVPFAALSWLNMSKARAVGDAGIAHLRNLHRLEVLDLYAARVSDAGLEHLGGLTALQRLNLGGTRVRGSGLRHLSSLRALRRLDLQFTRVGDGALAHLRELPLLQELVVADTLVTRPGADAFRAARPSCSVVGYWDQNEAELARAWHARAVLTVLVHRIAARHPVDLHTPEEALIDVVKRLLPSGTRLDGWAADGSPLADITARVDWDAASPWEADRALHGFLARVPRRGRVGITLPGGSRYTVPWMIERGPERRRGLPRPIRRMAH